MPEPAVFVAAVVLGAQLILPLALGGPGLLRDFGPSASTAVRPSTAPEPIGKRRRGKRGKEGESAPVARPPALAPLRCPACAAPVPLLAASFPCPSCAATVSPPPEYVRAIDLARESGSALARAERLWRVTRWACSPLAVWGLRVAVVGWCFAVVWSIYVGRLAEIPSLALLLPALLVIVQLFFGFAVAGALADVRRSLPPVPRARAFDLAPANASCQSCAGATRFDAHRLSASCGYCGGENYRAALADALHAHAATGAGAARASLRAQMSAAEARADSHRGVLQLTAIAELFYAGVVVIAGMSSLMSWL